MSSMGYRSEVCFWHDLVTQWSNVCAYVNVVTGFQGVKTRLYYKHPHKRVSRGVSCVQNFSEVKKKWKIIKKPVIG